jgi:hypothetical protein
VQAKACTLFLLPASPSFLPRLSGKSLSVVILNEVKDLRFLNFQHDIRNFSYDEAGKFSPHN